MKVYTEFFKDLYYWHKEIKRICWNIQNHSKYLSFNKHLEI